MHPSDQNAARGVGAMLTVLYLQCDVIRKGQKDVVFSFYFKRVQLQSIPPYLDYPTVFMGR